MRTCKWCGKTGWLLKISKDGLCQKCDPEVQARITHTSRVLNENLVMMRHAKDVETQLSKGQHAIKQLLEIIPYYEKGLVSLKPSPQEMVARIHHEERRIVGRHIETKYKAALLRARQVSDNDLREQYLNEVLGEITRYSPQLGKAITMRWEKKIASDKAALLIEKEQEGIAKGSRLAIDQYIEALDMMRTDDMGDPENQHRIAKIKKRIRDLGGELPQRWESSGNTGGMSGDSLP